MESNNTTLNEATPLLTGQVKETSDVVEGDNAISSTTPDNSDPLEAGCDVLDAIQDISNVPPVKVTETVEDIVQDLENFLWETRDIDYSLTRDILPTSSNKPNSSVETVVDDPKKVCLDDLEQRHECNNSDVTLQTASTSQSSEEHVILPITKVIDVSNQIVAETSDELQATSNEDCISREAIHDNFKESIDVIKIPINEMLPVITSGNVDSNEMSSTTTDEARKGRGFSNDEFENFQSALTRTLSNSDDNKIDSAIGDVQSNVDISTTPIAPKLETSDVQETNEAVALFSTDTQETITTFEKTEMLFTDTSSHLLNETLNDSNVESISGISNSCEINETKIDITNATQANECNNSDVINVIERIDEAANHKEPDIHDSFELLEDFVLPEIPDLKIQNIENSDLGVLHDIAKETDVETREFLAEPGEIAEGNSVTANSADSNGASAKEHSFESDTGLVTNLLNESVVDNIDTKTLENLTEESSLHENFNTEPLSPYDTKSVTENISVKEIDSQSCNIQVAEMEESSLNKEEINSELPLSTTETFETEAISIVQDRADENLQAKDEGVTEEQSETNIYVQNNSIINSETLATEQCLLSENQSNKTDDEDIKHDMDKELQANIISNKEALITEEDPYKGIVDDLVEERKTDSDLHSSFINNETIEMKDEHLSKTEVQNHDTARVEMEGCEILEAEKVENMNVSETNETNSPMANVLDETHVEGVVDVNRDLSEINNLVSDASNDEKAIALDMKDAVDAMDSRVYDQTTECPKQIVIENQTVCAEQLSDRDVSNDSKSNGSKSIQEIHEENKPAIETIGNKGVDQININEMESDTVQSQVCDTPFSSVVGLSEVSTETKSGLEYFIGMNNYNVTTVNETLLCPVPELNESVNLSSDSSEDACENVSNVTYSNQKEDFNNDRIIDKQLNENDNDLRVFGGFELSPRTETNENDTPDIYADVETLTEKSIDDADSNMAAYDDDISDKCENTNSEIIPLAAALYSAADDESTVTTTEMDIAVNSIMLGDQSESHVTIQLLNSSNSLQYIQPNLVTESASAVEALISAELNDNAVHSNTVDYDPGFNSLPQFKTSFMASVVPTAKGFEPSVIELNCAVASILDESCNSAISELEFAVASTNDVSTSSLAHLPIDLQLDENSSMDTNLADDVQSSVASCSEQSASNTLFELESGLKDISEQLVTQSNIEDNPQESEDQLVALQNLVTEAFVPDNETEQAAELAQPLSVDVEDHFNEQKDSIVTSTQTENITITSPESQKNMSSLKITIGKNDNQHSILKIYNPNETQSYKEEAVESKKATKHILSADELQTAPKLTIKPIKPPDSSNPKITIKPVLKPEAIKVTLRPTKTIQTSTKLPDPTEIPHHSPKITIKPIVKPENNEEAGTKNVESDRIMTRARSIEECRDVLDEKSSSPKLSIKPSSKLPEEEDYPSSLKITIKPVVKSSDEMHYVEERPKITIKPIIKPEEPATWREEKHGPRITIKPVIKPSESEAISPPISSSKKRDHLKEESVDLPKLNIKPLSKPEEISTFGENKQSSPRIVVKPVVKPSESDHESKSSDHHKEPSTESLYVQPLKLNIKPVVRPEKLSTSNQVIQSPPRITIKPLIKPPESDHLSPNNEQGSSLQPLKLSIKPVLKSEERLAFGEDIHSPTRITIKPVVKPQETGKISPSKLRDRLKEQSTDLCPVQPLKLNIKPVVKPVELSSGEDIHSPPRITIKPVMKPPESDQISSSKLHDHLSQQRSDSSSVQSLKLNIKPVVKPDQVFAFGEDIHNPTRITIKPVVKPSEVEQMSPSKICKDQNTDLSSVQPLKLTIKPVVKPVELAISGEDIHIPSQITIKPVIKSPDGGQISLHDHLKQESTDSFSVQPLKPNIKPDEFFSSIEDKQSPQRFTIKPIIKPPDGEHSTPSMYISNKAQDDLQEQSADSYSTQPIKLNIKPVVKPPVTSILQSFLKSGELPKKPTELIDFEDQIKQERIILKIAKAGKRGRPPLSQAARVNSLKLKLCRDSQKRSLSIERDDYKHLKKDSESNSGSASYTKDETNQESVAQHELHLEREEFHDPLAEIPVFEISTKSIASVPTADLKEKAMEDATPVVVTPPAPRKRGRPRKVPLQVREEFKDSMEEGVVQSFSTEEQLLVAEEPVRPKRSCRGPSARSALGMRPRKPRGSRGSRGGGSNRGTRAKSTRKPKEPKLPVASLNLFPEPLLTDCERTDTDVKNAEFKPVPLPSEIGSNNREVVIYEEETRMSAENSSRAHTPAKQVLSSTEVVEESQSSVQSNATTESGEKIHKSRKGSRVEVHNEPEGEVLSADKLAEYSWGGGGPYMLQEQVAQFLGIKSFKRKYPGIQRRTVDMQERDFIRESCLASEAMCDMGLTAVKSEDILDIMYTDFQHKYEEYCKHQRDRQAKDVSNKQKALSLAASQEKNKIDIVEQAVKSAHQWNINFNKTRREQRRSCMDLQTFTVHYPKGKLKQINKEPIGNYPLSLVPGQYSDYYKKYTPRELSSLPLNTVGPGSNVDMEDSQSDGSGSDSDSSSSNSDSSSSGSSDDCKVCNTRSTVTKKQLVR